MQLSKIDGIYTVALRRQNDIAIMDYVYANKFSKLAQTRINKMRIFLQVECLSEEHLPSEHNKRTR